jgi:hypothetical protein
MRRGFLIGVMALVMTTGRIEAWGSDGHEIVARIAAHHLTKNTRAAIAKLLNLDTEIPTLALDPTPDALADAMAIAATWPDRINKTKTGTSAWHFIDIGLKEGQEAIAKRCGAARNCATGKIAEFQLSIRANKSISSQTTTFEPFEELKFLIHLVGDIHQPLHAATNQDAGGNCLETSGFDETELHAVWDTGLINEIRKAPPQRASKSPSVHSLVSTTQVAAALDATIDQQRVNLFSQKLDPVLIALESHQTAIIAAYAPLKPVVQAMPGFVDGIRPKTCVGVPDDFRKNARDTEAAYNAATIQTVRTQLQMAGIRLAQTLNAMFDSAGRGRSH